MRVQASGLRRELLLIGLVAGSVHLSCSRPQIQSDSIGGVDVSTHIRLAMDNCGKSLLEGPALHSVSIGVYTAGDSQLAHYGTLDPSGNAPPTNKTVYEIASITKLLTGILAAQAIVDGELTLDHEVAPLLPGTYTNLHYQGEPILFRHLLTHTSGLPFSLHAEEMQAREIWGPDLPTRLNALAPIYNRELFWRDLHEFELSGPPGITSQYSNVGTDLVASILERVYKTDFRELVHRRVLGPAGMIDTRWALAPEQIERLAPGFGQGGVRVPTTIITRWGGADGLNSTPADLMRLIRLQLDKPSPAIELSRDVVYENARTSLAYFWHVERRDTDSPWYIYHGGAYGAQNYLLLIPGSSLGISIITNKSDNQTGEWLYQGLCQLVEELEGVRDSDQE